MSREDLRLKRDAIEPLIPFEIVAERFDISVRALKNQVRAHKAERVVLGKKWFFTPAQFTAFRAARTVSTGADTGPNPIEQARARVANRQQHRRRRASSWGTR